MSKRKFTRREVITTASAGAMGTMMFWPFRSFSIGKGGQEKLAIKGGTPVHSARWGKWPIWDSSAEQPLLEMFRTGNWSRGKAVGEFEKQYAAMLGVKNCLATSSGTSSLLVALEALGVDAGDEVLVSPYTFVATHNVIVLQKALPVFVDTDPETFLMDTGKIEGMINDRTSAILPVHIYGLPADMDVINGIAKKRNLVVIEDACQAWLSEYKGKKAGTFGNAGCFSFQNSKNLPSGEGGAIVSNNDELMDLCHAINNCGRPFGSMERKSQYPVNGGNTRIMESQGLILLSQIKRIQEDFEKRTENARYLTSELAKVPGIKTVRLTDQDAQPSYHLYPVRYDSKVYNNVPKDKFLQALRAEGIPASGGYTPQNKEAFLERTLNSKGYKRLFSAKRLKQWRDENVLPGNDQVCQEAVLFSQSLLLGSRSDMEDIVRSFHKIYDNRDQLV